MTNLIRKLDKELREEDIWHNSCFKRGQRPSQVLQRRGLEWKVDEWETKWIQWWELITPMFWIDFILFVFGVLHNTVFIENVPLQEKVYSLSIESILKIKELSTGCCLYLTWLSLHLTQAVPHMLPLHRNSSRVY